MFYIQYIYLFVSYCWLVGEWSLTFSYMESTLLLFFLQSSIRITTMFSISSSGTASIESGQFNDLWMNLAAWTPAFSSILQLSKLCVKCYWWAIAIGRLKSAWLLWHRFSHWTQLSCYNASENQLSWLFPKCIQCCLSSFSCILVSPKTWRPTLLMPLVHPKPLP